MTAQASQVRARAWRRVSWMWHGHFPAHRPAVCRGKRFGLVEMGEPFPVLQKLVKAEAAAAQRGCRVAAESSGEGEPDRFLAFLGKTGLAGKGAAAERCPLPDLLRVGGAVAQRQEGAVEDVGVEREQADFVDEAAGVDQLAGAGFALVGFELGFLLGRAFWLAAR